MALIYPKSLAECSDSVFNGKINDENSKAALGFVCRSNIDDKFGCMGERSNNRNY